MNIKKAVSAFAAAMAAATMFSVIAFAETTIQPDSEYAGNWGAGTYIPQDELEAGEPEKAARIIDNGNVIPYCFSEYEMSTEKESSAFAAKRKISKSQSAAFFSKMRCFFINVS